MLYVHACFIFYNKKASKSMIKIFFKKIQISIIFLLLFSILFSFSSFSDDGMTEEERQRIINSQNNIEKINASK